MKMIAALLLAVALPASAEFVVVEETETMTVYREGAQYIVFAFAPAAKTMLPPIIRARSPGAANRFTLRNMPKRSGVRMYFARTRVVDGAVICEKFVNRPPDEHLRQIIAVVAAGPCS